MLYNKFPHLSLLLPSGQACVGVVETSLSASIVNSCLFTTRFLCTLCFLCWFFLSHQNNKLMITSPSFVYSSYFLLEAREVDFLFVYKYWPAVRNNKNFKWIFSNWVQLTLLRINFPLKQIDWWTERICVNYDCLRPWRRYDLWSVFLVCLRCCLGGLMGYCCGRSSPWEARRTQGSQWKNSLNCWRKDIEWTSLPTAPMNCRCLYKYRCVTFVYRRLSRWAKQQQITPGPVVFLSNILFICHIYTVSMVGAHIKYPSFQEILYKLHKMCTLI